MTVSSSQSSLIGCDAAAPVVNEACTRPSPGVFDIPRSVRPLGTAPVTDRFRMKWYSINAPFEDDPRTTALIRAAADLAREVHVEREARSADFSQAGFGIIHCGKLANWLLLDWWESDFLLHQRLFRAELDDEAHFLPGRTTLIACTWELALIAHERNAWVEVHRSTYLPRRSPIDDYLAMTFEGDI